MSILTHIDDLKSHPLFTALVESFPEERQWLNSATPTELISGIHPSALWDPDEPMSFETYYVRNLFKKVENLDVGIDPNKAAFDDIKSFLNEQETKMLTLRATLANLTPDNDLSKVLEWVKRWFKMVFKEFDLNSIVPRYTSGATLTLKRGMSVFDRYKAAEGVDALRERNFLSREGLESLLSGDGSVRSSGNLYNGLLFTPYKAENASSHFYVLLSAVSKTADMSRIVGIQPSVVLAQQVGFGDELVGILKKHCGIDLSTAPDIHKELAMDGSLTGLLATLDQRKASDHILRILCEHVVEKRIFDYMCAITPSTISVEGEMMHTHMMCPAGNGFIFQFQTILFWALIQGTQAITRKHNPVWVFGDDVILSTAVYDDVCAVFQAVGLKVNEDKSFKDGPFRESCGGDFLYGSNVRPQYVKRIPAKTIEWIRVINGIRRIGYYANAGTWRSDPFRGFWLRCIRTIPVKERLFCPRHYGDSGINSEYESLYRLATPTCTDAEGIKYSSPTDATGNYYNSERIKLLVAYSSSDSVSFAEVSKGVPADAILRLLTQPSVKGSGGSMRTVRKNGERVRSFVYPKVFNGSFEGYREQNVPYTTFGSAPNETDELFSFLEKNHPCLPILKSDAVIERYQARIFEQRLILVDTLKKFLAKHQEIESRAIQDLSAFCLSRG